VIRPFEIDLLMLYDMRKWLTKFEFEETQILESKKCISIKIKKSYYDHFFDVAIQYNDVSRMIYISVICSSPIPKDKTGYCLKLLNFISVHEKEAKYALCPYNHLISCSTSHSILDCQCSIGQLVEGQAYCSIENLSDCYNAIIHNNVKICGISPIRFFNDFWTGTDQ